VGPKGQSGWGGKSRPTGIRSPDRPARSLSLYLLSYLTHAVYEMVWENTEGPDGPQMAIWRTRIARWMTKRSLIGPSSALQPLVG
jgi:hypothetical protein